MVRENNVNINVGCINAAYRAVTGMQCLNKNVCRLCYDATLLTQNVSPNNIPVINIEQPNILTPQNSKQKPSL